MPNAPLLNINDLLQATETLSITRATGLEETYYQLLSDEDNLELLERMNHIAELFDYWEDWEPAFAEALDTAREKVWIDDDGNEVIFNCATHVICLAYQAMVYKKYLTSEEFDSATEPALSILLD